MNELGLTHILLTLAAYALYMFFFIKALSKNYPYRVLHLGNALYVSGFVLGMIWANVEWGYVLPLDMKIVISLFVPVPFILESIFKRRDLLALSIGFLLVILNYTLPLLVGTIHTH